MSKRRKVLLPFAAALLLLVLGALLYDPTWSEPHYKDRPLSEWVEMYRPLYSVNTGQRRIKTEPSPGDAIRAIGPRALPYLLSWTKYEMPWWQDKLLWLSSKMPAGMGEILIDPFLRGTDVYRARCAMEAFFPLRSVADSAIPELAKRAGPNKDPVTRRFAIGALVHIGSESAVNALVTSPGGQSVEMVAAGFAGNMGTNASRLVPWLAANLETTNSLAIRWTAKALGDIGIQAELVVPQLAKALSVQDMLTQLVVIQALTKFGPLARPAVPALSNQLSNPYLRWHVTNALEKINSKTLLEEPPS